MKKLTRTEFRDGAKNRVLRHIKTLFQDADSVTLHDVRIVWILRYGKNDWKGQFDTSVPDGKIYEVDYSNRTEMFYLYEYAKITTYPGFPREVEEEQNTEDSRTGG